MLNKKRFLHKYFDYRARLNRGSYWWVQIDEFIPISKFIDYFYTYVIVKMATQNSTGWLIVGALVWLGYKVLLQVIMLILTRIDHNYGIQKLEIDWQSKNEKYNTYLIEQKETLEAIAKKVGAESKFKNLEE